MRRSLSIFLWILVGATASGLAIGYFLYQANADRERLSRQVETAKQHIEETQASNQKLAQEANQKLAAASQQVLKAQELLKRYEEERLLMARAIPIQKPSPRELTYWKSVLSLPLGLTLQLPPEAEATSTDQALIATVHEPIAGGNDWLVITPYDQKQEVALIQMLEDSTSSVALLANGRVFFGLQGRIRDTAAQGRVLRVRGNASSTYLIWARHRALISDQKILKTLATIHFRP